jgi:hypothetical protein
MGASDHHEPVHKSLLSLTVRELMGRVRNVVLMNVYLELGNPGGVGILGRGVYEPGEGNGEVSLRATWERGGRILSQLGGFQVSKEGEKGEQGEQRGGKRNQQGKEREYAVYINCVSPMYIMECL